MARRPTTPAQQTLRFRRGWGGQREGAGRKRSRHSGVSHLRRPTINRHIPAHVTLKLRRDLRSLRTKKKAKAIRRAIAQACNGHGFRIIDWSIQRDHLHLTVEADSRLRLSRGMQGLNTRLARGLNRELCRSGRVFADRYHVRLLRTPREVRNARAYVINNARRHAAQRNVRMNRTWVDPLSSGAWFDGWKFCRESWRLRALDGVDDEAPTAEPRSWLMRVGWRRVGLVRVDEVPGVVARR